MHSTHQNIPAQQQADDPAADLRERFRKAKAARAAWETRWNDCFDYTLPLSSELQGRGTSPNQPGRRADALFDGTAADAVDQLAASLLAQLTPPWSRWFAFQPGEEIDEALQGQVATLLDRASAHAVGFLLVGSRLWRAAQGRWQCDRRGVQRWRWALLPASRGLFAARSAPAG